jgi:hypothetical protein
VNLHPFSRRLLRVWLWVVALAAAGELFVLALGVVPIIQLVALPFVPLPTAALYLTPVVAAYLALAALWRLLGHTPSARARGAMLALPLGVVLGLGWLAAMMLNGRAPELPPVAAPPEPVTMTPVQRVALIAIRDHFPPAQPTCNAFCVALLLSGMAQQVDVANVDSGALHVALPVPAGRFSVRADNAGCQADPMYWPAWMEDRTLEGARRTGGFDQIVVDRFRGCISGMPASVGPADLRFVNAMPKPPSMRWLGIEWSLPAGTVGFEWRVEAAAEGAGAVLAQWLRDGLPLLGAARAEPDVGQRRRRPQRYALGPQRGARPGRPCARADGWVGHAAQRRRGARPGASGRRPDKVTIAGAAATAMRRAVAA